MTEPNDRSRPNSQVQDPWIGTTFAERYRVERRLGEGGMGVVYAARQLTMDRVVALKVLSTDLSGSSASRARFVREMKAASRIEHPNTVRVYDFGEGDQGQLFLTMELLDGRTLQHELHERGALDLHRVLAIGETIARALAAAHQEGVVHRDLKPENVMLLDKYGERDQVRVLDFGIARLLDGDESDAVTRTGSLLGTPLYMSPEAALGQKVDGRADLYALGLILFQMATGQLPFRDAQPLRVLYMHAHQVPPSPATLSPGRVPAALDALILRLLAKNPADRPADATSAALALRAIAESRTFEERDPSHALAPGSRLADNPQAMAAARALHDDPQRAVATISDPVVVATHAGPVDVTAQTMASQDAALTGAATLVGGGPELTGAPTLAGDLRTPRTPSQEGLGPATVADPAPAPAAMAADGDSAEQTVAVQTQAEPPATAAPAVATETPAPISAPGSREGAEPSTTVSAPHDHARARWPAIVAAAVIALAGATWWIGRPAPPTPQVPDAAPPPTAAEAPNSATAPQAAPRADAGSRLDAALRAEADAALVAASIPACPERCRASTDAEVALVRDGARLLLGATAQGRRPQDEEAAERLATATSPEAQALRAWAMLAAGRGHVEVIHVAETALRACPATPLAERVRGQIHLQGARWAVAAEALERALSHAPDDPGARYLLGVARLGEREPKRAAGAFEAVLRRKPADVDALSGLGRALLADGQPARARATLERAQTLAPERGDIVFFLGAVAKAGGDSDNAQTLFCKAFDLGYAAARGLCPRAAAGPGATH